MNTQRIEISNIVRSILLIAIGIVIGIGISVGINIGRIGNPPSSVSQRVSSLERRVDVTDFSSRVDPFNASVERTAEVAQFNVAVAGRVAADAVQVTF